MAEQTFRSPGFFEREVDLTQRTTEVVGVPGGVIGTSLRGPAFVPITVGNFADFEEKFGTLDPDHFGPYAVNEWLKNKTALTFIRVLGAGANNSTTDIAATQQKGTVKNAGFVVKGNTTALGGGDTGGGTGFVQFLAAAHEVKTNAGELNGYPVFTDNDSVDTSGNINLIRACLFTASGSRFQVLDTDKVYSGAMSNHMPDFARISTYNGGTMDGTFKLILSSAIGSDFGNDEGHTGLRIFTASLDPQSVHYVGKILNTNPDRFGSEQHLLYCDYAVESELAQAAYSVQSASVAILSGSGLLNEAGGGLGTSYTDIFGSFNTRYKAARTTSFISQPFGSTEHDLFHFETLDDGANSNARFKVSISNLRRSTNPKDPYGTFTVLIRAFDDTDTNLKILEQYPLCTLNTGDDSYVGSRIGDMKVYYNFDAETESERRLNVTGKRPNNSKFVRIIMNSKVEDGLIPKDALPFGFRGLPVLKTNDMLTDGTIDPSTTPLSGLGSNKATKPRLHAFTGSLYVNSASLAGTYDWHKRLDRLTGSIVPPVPMRFKATRGAVKDTSSPSYTGFPGSLEAADNRFFWGVKFETVPTSGSFADAALQANASGTPNPLIKALSKLQGIELMGAVVTGSGADAFHNNKFTLARVALSNSPGAAATVLADEMTNEVTGTASDHMREAAYIRNGIPKAPKYTVHDGYINRLTLGSMVAASSATTFNRFTEYLKFTNMFYGGFDGLNILDRDQRLMNDRASSLSGGGKAAGGAFSYENLHEDSGPGVSNDNNIISSYRSAINIMTDPFATRVNVVAVPGIRDTYVTDYAIDKTKAYSKAIYIMDMPAYDDDSNRLYDGSPGRPNVRKSSEQFDGRAVDNNYAATYFPDVIIEDVVNQDAVTVPASVSALGALAHNDKIAFPWFAPAGFSRGALREVLNTTIRLNAEDRNVLYESRINPIASFPNGGFVIFGQKTLQLNRSALDRVNVRRMLLEVKRIVSDVANDIIFEQNTPQTRAKFLTSVKPKLALIQSQQGIDQFNVIMDSTNNTQADIESNKLNGRVILVPTRAVEFIAIDFIITNAGVSFE
jgi:hypothetical protein